MSRDQADLQALSDRTISSWQGYPGIEVRWWPYDIYVGSGRWHIRLAVAWQGKGVPADDQIRRRRWIDVRGETLNEAIVRAGIALDKEGR
jgi:hypothetical protein